jgi:periplasmic divalent cation tolerance protein
MAFLLFYVTCPSQSTALDISQEVVSQGLAACANVFPSESVYWWKDVPIKEKEWVIMIKTSALRELELEKAILELHPDEVPCIIRFESKANEAYERWVEESTSPAK